MTPAPSKFLNRRTIGLTLASFGATVLLASLLAIMARLGTPWIWNLAAHEDGVRTFGATFFYFEHAVRELPGDLMLGAVIGGALAYAYPLKAGGRGAKLYAAGLLFVLAVMVTGAVSDVGFAGVVDNLLQKHTRPGAALEWGAHWRYHLLSSFALYLMSFGAAGLLRFLDGAGTAGEAARGSRIIAGALASFLGVTLLFAHSPAGLAKPFTDAIYIGHEARELFTSVLATLPIAFGLGLLAATGSNAPASGADRTAHRASWIGAIVAGIALGLYLCLGAVFMDAAASGQTDDVVMLIAPHFFEHAQTYAVVTLTALMVHRLAAGQRQAEQKLAPRVDTV